MQSAFKNSRFPTRNGINDFPAEYGNSEAQPPLRSLNPSGITSLRSRKYGDQPVGSGKGTVPETKPLYETELMTALVKIALRKTDENFTESDKRNAMIALLAKQARVKFIGMNAEDAKRYAQQQYRQFKQKEAYFKEQFLHPTNSGVSKSEKKSLSDIDRVLENQTIDIRLVNALKEALNSGKGVSGDRYLMGPGGEGAFMVDQPPPDMNIFDAPEPVRPPGFGTAAFSDGAGAGLTGVDIKAPLWLGVATMLTPVGIVVDAIKGLVDAEKNIAKDNYLRAAGDLGIALAEVGASVIKVGVVSKAIKLKAAANAAKLGERIARLSPEFIAKRIAKSMTPKELGEKAAKQFFEQTFDIIKRAADDFGLGGAVVATVAAKSISATITTLQSTVLKGVGKEVWQAYLLKNRDKIIAANVRKLLEVVKDMNEEAVSKIVGYVIDGLYKGMFVGEEGKPTDRKDTEPTSRTSKYQ